MKHNLFQVKLKILPKYYRTVKKIKKKKVKISSRKQELHFFLVREQVFVNQTVDGVTPSPFSLQLL